MIEPGLPREQEIARHLEEARIILLLISPDFLASEYGYSNELSKALESQADGKATVIPILLRNVDLAHLPFSLQVLPLLPANGVPVADFPDADQAFQEIAETVDALVSRVSVRPQSLPESVEAATESVVTYQVTVDAPASSVSVQEMFEITVRLHQLEASSELVSGNTITIPARLVEGGEVDVLLTAPAFQVQGDCALNLALDAAGMEAMEQEARFQLVALNPGSETISIELFHNAACLLKVPLEIRVEYARGDEVYAIHLPSAFVSASPPDLVLQIRTEHSEVGDARVLHYTLQQVDNTQATEYRSGSFSGKHLDALQALFAETVEAGRQTMFRNGYRHLAAFGRYCFEHLLPFDLQTALQENLPASRSLLVLADRESWFPWELLHDGRTFLQERLVIGRWPCELRNQFPYEFPLGPVQVAHYASVDPLVAEKWVDFLRFLEQESPGELSEALFSLLPDGLLQNLEGLEAIRGLHLMRMGESPAQLSQTFLPVQRETEPVSTRIEEEIASSKLQLQTNHPLVTLSYLSQGKAEPTSLEKTWALAFLHAGCRAFVGPLWAVRLEVEAAFLSSFYRYLWAGYTLGTAFDLSRRIARSAVPESLDWLAYICFGNPDAHPYYPIQGKGYATVECSTHDIAEPVPPGDQLRFRARLRRRPPVWHEERVIEIAEHLQLPNLRLSVATSVFQLQETQPIVLTCKPDGDYFGLFTLNAPVEAAGQSDLVEIFFEDDEGPVHHVQFTLSLAGREDQADE